MANVQKEHGYTAIANTLLEQLPRAGLTATQLDIMLVLLRRTYGYQQKRCSINIARLVRATGRDRKLIKTALAQLDQMNLIHVEPGQSSLLIAIQKDHDRWRLRAKSKPASDVKKASTIGQNTPSSRVFYPPGKTPHPIGCFTPSDRVKHPPIKENYKENYKENPPTPLSQTETESASISEADSSRMDEKQNGGDQMRDFDALWAIRPEREGGHSRVPAQRAYEFAIARGVNHADMLDGWRRYIRYAEAKGDVIGTQWCKTLHKFLEQQCWQDDWTPPRPQTHSIGLRSDGWPIDAELEATKHKSFCHEDDVRAAVAAGEITVEQLENDHNYVIVGNVDDLRQPPGPKPARAGRSLH